MCDMLEGNGDLHLNFVPDYNGWDVCGPAALLMSRLGYCADSMGQPLYLESKRNQYKLWNGFIAARHLKSFKEIK
jgi:3'-phosphoadenosine 5'-phosphosulfate (PAPS) 3'-phosphatase